MVEPMSPPAKDKDNAPGSLSDSRGDPLRWTQSRSHPSLMRVNNISLKRLVDSWFFKQLFTAASQASPSATAKRTFSVPARLPNSCPAPVMKDPRESPSLMYNAPIPFGA